MYNIQNISADIIMQIIEAGERVTSAQRVFTFFFVFSIILNGYSIGVPGVSLGSAVYIVIIIMAVLSFIVSNKKLKLSFLIMLPFFFIGITFISRLTYRFAAFSFTAFIFGMSKMFLIIAITCVAAPLWFNYNEFYKQLYRIVFIMTIYITLQTIMFRFGVLLPNIVEFGLIQPYSEGYSGVVANAYMIRPAGLLSEPAVYGTVMGVAIPMFFERNVQSMTLKKWAVILFFSAGVVMSTSTTGIIFLIMIWGIYIFRFIKGSRMGVFILTLLTSAVLLVSILALGGDSLPAAFSNNKLVEYTLYKLNNMDNISRVGGSFEVLGYVEGWGKFIGIGWGNAAQLMRSVGYTSDNPYINDAAALLINSGYVGCGLFIIFLLRLLSRCIRRKDMLSFVLLLQYSIRPIQGGGLFNFYSALYVTVIYYRLYMRPNYIIEKVNQRNLSG